MFKRVEKRRRKKEEEEELGLDEDMKEVLGIQDTDSEESDSDSDQSGDEDESSDAGEVGMEEDEGDLNSQDDEESASEQEEDPAITVSEALKDPIYLASIQPEVRACIVCPGKLLKGSKMVEVHRISNAHKRRFAQFSSFSRGLEEGESAWEVLKRCLEEKPKLSLTSSAGHSKRAEKRKAHWQKKREKARAKKVVAATRPTKNVPAPGSKTEAKEPPKTDSIKPDSPPKKKQRVLADTSKMKVVGKRSKSSLRSK